MEPSELLYLLSHSFYLFIHLFLAALGLHCCADFSLVARHELLIGVASLGAGHGLSGTRASVAGALGSGLGAPGLQSTGSIPVVQGFVALQHV